MGEVVAFPDQNQKAGGEIGAHFETQAEQKPVKTQLRTSVSKMALLLPDIFMSNSDAERMIKMLEETRSEVNGVVGKEPEVILAVSNNNKT